MRTIHLILIVLLACGVMPGCKRRAVRGTATAPRTTAPSAENIKNEELDRLKAQLEEIPPLREGVNYTDPATGELWQRFPNGMMFRDLKIGMGMQPILGQTVSVAYTGTVYGATKTFDQRTPTNPYKFPLGRKTEIKGFNMGIATMRQGSKRVIFIPPELGYGAMGLPTMNIEGNRALVFEVELLDIEGEGIDHLGPEFTMPVPLGPNLPAETATQPG